MRREPSTSGNTRHSAIQVVSQLCLGKVQGLFAIRRSQRDAKAFRRGLIALGGNTADGDQNMGLRIVCGSAPAGNRIGDDRKAESLAHFSFEVNANFQDLTGLELWLFDRNRFRPAGLANLLPQMFRSCSKIDSLKSTSTLKS